MSDTAYERKVMKACDDGKPIQEDPYRRGEWEDRKTEPPWNWAQSNYRIKPEPLELWVNVYDSNSFAAYKDLETAQNCAGFNSCIVRMRQVLDSDAE